MVALLGYFPDSAFYFVVYIVNGRPGSLAVASNMRVFYMIKFAKKLFRQKTVKLCNGDIVRYGDKVQFIDSDGDVRRGVVGRHYKTGKLYIFNNTFPVTAYKSARKGWA